MPKNSKAFLPLITAAIFIAMEIAAVAMLKSSSTLQDVWLNRASHRVMGKLWSGGETVRNHFSLSRQNDALTQENFALRERLREYELAHEAAVEAGESASMAGRRFTYIPATVVKMSRNSMHNYIILNKGSEDGVKPHSGIIADKGVVGTVCAVDEHYSYGLTIMNTKTSISARIGKTGIVAPVVWDGIHSNRGVLKDIPMHCSIEPGDTVVTSGFSSVFPPDLPIGVTGDTHVADGVTNNTDVIFFQDFSTLRYVTIVENPERGKIENLENSEEEDLR